MNNFFDEAIKQSKKSSYKIKVGSVVVRKNKIVGKGFNIVCSNGNDRYTGIHAEISAINHTTARLRQNATVIVARVSNTGKLGMSKPCESCETILRKLGIKRVWYSTADGWNKMSL